MNQWHFKTKIYTGIDSLNRLKDIKNERILIVCDPFLKDSIHLNTVENLVNSKNMIAIYSDVVPDPPISYVVRGIEFTKSFKPTVIIAIGGGSAIDMSKGIYYFGQKLGEFIIRKFIAIPTTSGTGSEVTSFAVLTDSVKNTKYPLITDDILPNEAILAPLFVMTSPSSVTAYSGIDALVHALEAYVAVGANRFTDALAEQAITLILTYLPQCYKSIATEFEWNAMLEAACMAGLAFNKAGLGLVHAMAHQLGAQFHIPHGLANSMLLPHVMTFNVSRDEKVLKKYADLAVKLGLADKKKNSAVEQFTALLCECMKLIKQVDCPIALSSLDISEYEVKSKLSLMIKRATEDMCYQYSPYKANQDEIQSLYIKIL